MELYTAQLAQWRYVKSQAIPLLDVTVKSGDTHFAPTRDLLNQYLYKGLSEADYRKTFINLMSQSYYNNTTHWLTTLQQDKLAIACYCKPGAFCHRLILIPLFKRVCEVHGIPFHYHKELYHVNSLR